MRPTGVASVSNRRSVVVASRGPVRGRHVNAARFWGAGAGRPLRGHLGPRGRQAQVGAGPGGDVSGTRFEVCSGVAVGQGAAGRGAVDPAVAGLVAARVGCRNWVTHSRACSAAGPARVRAVAAGAPAAAVRAAKVVDCQSWATRSKGCSAGADAPARDVRGAARHRPVGVRGAVQAVPGGAGAWVCATRSGACSAAAVGQVVGVRPRVRAAVRGAAYAAVHAVGPGVPRAGWAVFWGADAQVRPRPVGPVHQAGASGACPAVGVVVVVRVAVCRGGCRSLDGPDEQVCGGVRSAVHGPDVSLLPGGAGCWLPVGCCSARFSPGSGNPCRELGAMRTAGRIASLTVATTSRRRCLESCYGVVGAAPG
jgi:hypothetical protein